MGVVRGPERGGRLEKHGWRAKLVEDQAMTRQEHCGLISPLLRNFWGVLGNIYMLLFITLYISVQQGD